LFRGTGIALLVAAALTVGAAGCGGGDDSTTTNTVTAQSGGGGTAAGGATAGGKSAAPRAETVDMEDFDFSPAKVTIQAGGKVTWKNMGQTAHTATADDGSFDTGTVDPGKLKSEAKSFKSPGTFTYSCTIHPQMHGTIEVVAG
jgi:plastocyanin